MYTKLQKARIFLSQPPSVEWAIYAGFAALLILAALVRFFLIHFQTLDYGVFSAWYDFIKAHGFHSFRYNFANYNFSYTFVLYLFSHLPISKIAAIKGSMIIFDFIQAFAVYKLVGLFRRDHYTPLLAGLASLYLPTIFINSAFWAQIDATYTSFLILSLYFGLKNNSRLAWLFFGIAFGYKLQAIFFLPALLFMTFKRINWYDFYWAVLSYMVVVFPPVLFGRSIVDVANTYFEQSKQFHGQLTLKAPNFYQWLPNTTYPYFNRAGFMLTAAAVIFAALVGLIYKKHSVRELLVFSSLMLFVVPFLMPQMHERYFYPAEVSALVLAFVYPAYSWVVVLMQLVTFFAYWPFLFGRPLVPLAVLPFGVLIIICGLSVLYMKTKITDTKITQRLPKTNNKPVQKALT